MKILLRMTMTVIYIGAEVLAWAMSFDDQVIEIKKPVRSGSFEVAVTRRRTRSEVDDVMHDQGMAVN